MKKYTFRLEGVRRVRRLQEEQAKMALAAANNEVQRAIALVQQRLDEYQNKTAVAPSNSGVDAFMRQRYFSELAYQAVIDARSQQELAQQKAADLRRAWSDIAQQVKALDRLDERRREEYRLDFDREEAKEVDDIVVSRPREVA